MRFLMCIGGVEPSAETVRFGGRIARAFEADLSLLYVQPRVPQAVRQEIRMAREKLTEWAIEHPSVKVLRAACGILAEEGVLRSLPGAEQIRPEALKPGVRGAYELLLPGTEGRDVRLRIREGDIVGEVNKEIESNENDLVIFGASQQRAILHKLVQFIDSSVLIVKNPRDTVYEFLLCTDSSPAARKAELFAAKLARFLNYQVLVLSVAKFKSREHVAMEGAERTARLLAKAGIARTVAVKTGAVVDEIARLAREDTVVIMGASRRSEIRKLLFGSKPTQVIQRVPCPVLIVK
jgi:nucleotide-binding universal stress UspA family protein